ncbi:GNAT family N-acetyltransferase [Nocardiopsis deserti]|uniref:GNAT family N-acetyltransferase n=1 Tax=Nocardiopsis deserti TaxID=2605988 RepID=UPI00123C3941
MRSIEVTGGPLQNGGQGSRTRYPWAVQGSGGFTEPQPSTGSHHGRAGPLPLSALLGLPPYPGPGAPVRPPHGYVQAVVVDPAARRAGVGRALLGAFTATARETGLEWVFAVPDEAPASRAGWRGWPRPGSLLRSTRGSCGRSWAGGPSPAGETAVLRSFAPAQVSALSRPVGRWPRRPRRRAAVLRSRPRTCAGPQSAAAALETAAHRSFGG